MSNQKGISLLEILFSLTVIAVIFAIVANYFYTQNKNYLTVGKAATQIQQLADMSYEWQTAQGQNNFEGISQSALQQAGLLTVNDQYSQINPWGGQIIIAADNNDSRYVLITLSSVPTDACNNLRSRLNSIAHTQSSNADCTGGGYHISL